MDLIANHIHKLATCFAVKIFYINELSLILLIISQAARSNQDKQTTQPQRPLAPGGGNLEASGSDAYVSLTSEERRRVEALAAMFPGYSRDVLESILQQTGFSLDEAIELLQG